jgi:hypothetical protein
MNQTPPGGLFSTFASFIKYYFKYRQVFQGAEGDDAPKIGEKRPSAHPVRLDSAPDKIPACRFRIKQGSANRRKSVLVFGGMGGS